MSVILEMVRKYLKLNPKRTGIAVGSMILCVFLLTIASNTFVWGFDYMREVEEKINGTWQARYNGITKKQAEELESQAEISKCTLIKNEDGTYQADVEFSEVKKDVFEKNSTDWRRDWNDYAGGTGRDQYTSKWRGSKVRYSLSHGSVRFLWDYL